METNKQKLDPNGKLAAAIRKMAREKDELLECVRQNKPLSSLKKKGIILSKLG